MLNRFLTTLFCTACSLFASAQTKSVVIDMETRTPLAGVVVTVGAAAVSQRRTNYKGEFEIPAHADSIILGKSGYESRHLLRSELTDTIELMRTYNALNEVIIYGKLPQVGLDFSHMMNAMSEEQHMTPKSKPLVTFDFFSIFTKKKNKRTKERIKAIENY